MCSQQSKSASWRRTEPAGGEIDFEIFPGAEHRWIIQPGLQTDRAIKMIKAFIARQLRAQHAVS